MTVVLLPIAPGPVAAEAWRALEPHFVRACSRVHTDWTAAKIRAEAEAGKLTLWAIADPAKPLPLLGALATMIKTVNGEKVVVFAHLGGRDMHRWLDIMTGEIERLAKQQGASRAEIEGRMGWAREMRDCGYAPVRVVLQKVL